MERKFYTIQDLREGRVACQNDGTIEQLRDVIKVAFPEYGIIPIGNDHYYEGSRWQDGKWRSFKRTCLPIQSVKDFHKQLKKVKEIVTETLDLKEALEKYPFIGVDDYFEGRNSYRLDPSNAYDYNFIKSWIDGGKTKYYFFETKEMLNKWVNKEI